MRGELSAGHSAALPESGRVGQRDETAGGGSGKRRPWEAAGRASALTPVGRLRPVRPILTDRAPAGAARTILLAFRQRGQQTLNRMVHFSADQLDASFAALSDATRRGVLDQLKDADATVTKLAHRFGITPTGMGKHLAILERAGLVATEKIGRVRTCRLGPHALEEELAWIERYRQLWDARFNSLETVVQELITKEKIDGR
jgi:DNA-binding transcriptional ArsR family regulator